MTTEDVDRAVIDQALAVIASGHYPSLDRVYREGRGRGGPSRHAADLATRRLKNAGTFPLPEDARSLAAAEGHRARKEREAAERARAQAGAATARFRHAWTDDYRRGQALLRGFRRMIGRATP